MTESDVVWQSDWLDNAGKKRLRQVVLHFEFVGRKYSVYAIVIHSVQSRHILASVRLKLDDFGGCSTWSVCHIIDPLMPL